MSFKVLASAVPSPAPPRAAAAAARDSTAFPRQVRKATGFAKMTRIAVAHIGGDVFVNIPIITGHTEESPPQPAELETSSGGTVCFSSPLGENHVLTLRRPAVFVFPSLKTGSVGATADGRDVRAISAPSRCGRVFFLAPCSVRHVLLDSHRADVIDVRSEAAVISVAFHPQALRGEWIMLLLESGMVEVHYAAPSDPERDDPFSGIETSKRFTTLHFEALSAQTTPQSLAVHGKGKPALPHTMSNNRMTLPSFADFVILNETPTSPTIIVLLDTTGALWATTFDLENVAVSDPQARQKLPVKLLLPSEHVTAGVKGTQFATSLGVCCSDKRAGVFTFLVGVSTGNVDVVLVSEKLLAAVLAGSSSGQPAVTDLASVQCRITLEGATAAVPVGEQRSSNHSTIRITSTGADSASSNCFIATLTPHIAGNSANPSPIDEARTAANGMRPLRQNFLVCVPMWDADTANDSEACWRYSLHPDVPPAGYAATQPPPLCVPLPAVLVGGGRNANGDVVIAAPAVGGVPVLGDESISFFEAHLLPAAEAKDVAVRWHQADGVVIDPMRVPVSHLILSALRAQMAVQEEVSFESPPPNLPLATSTALVLGACQAHLAVLRHAHAHVVTLTGAKFKESVAAPEAAMNDLMKALESARAVVDANGSKVVAREQALTARLAALRKRFDERCVTITRACIAAETARIAQRGVDGIYELNEDVARLDEMLKRVEDDIGPACAW